MPFPVTKEVMARGQQRYNIYCAPCHSTLGDGNGVVPTRGFPQKPPSYHIERLTKAPLGYFFDVMTNGYGIMQDYSAQISPRDRWCIVAYIRALQLSQNATMADVPQGQSIPSKAPEFVEPGIGATLPQVMPEHEIRERGSRNEHGLSHPASAEIDLSPPPVVRTIRQRSLIVGVIATLVALVHRASRTRPFFRAYLVSFMDWLGSAWARWPSS